MSDEKPFATTWSGPGPDGPYTELRINDQVAANSVDEPNGRQLEGLAEKLNAAVEAREARWKSLIGAVERAGPIGGCPWCLAQVFHEDDCPAFVSIDQERSALRAPPDAVTGHVACGLAFDLGAAQAKVEGTWAVLADLAQEHDLGGLTAQALCERLGVKPRPETTLYVMPMRGVRSVSAMDGNGELANFHTGVPIVGDLEVVIRRRQILGPFDHDDHIFVSPDAAYPGPGARGIFAMRAGSPISTGQLVSVDQATGLVHPSTGLLPPAGTATQDSTPVLNDDGRPATDAEGRPLHNVTVRVGGSAYVMTGFDPVSRTATVSAPATTKQTAGMALRRNNKRAPDPEQRPSRVPPLPATRLDGRRRR